MRELALLLNISERNVRTYLGEDFEDHKNPQAFRAQTEDEKMRMQHAKTWLLQHTYCHHHNQRVTDLKFTKLFNKYHKETINHDYCAGIRLFTKAYDELAAHKSKHGNMDLYSCHFCHHNRIEVLEEAKSLPQFPYEDPKYWFMFRHFPTTKYLNYFLVKFPEIWRKWTLSRITRYILCYIAQFIVPHWQVKVLINEWILKLIPQQHATLSQVSFSPSWKRMLLDSLQTLLLWFLSKACPFRR